MAVEDKAEEKAQWIAAKGLEREIERVARHMKLEWPEVVDSWEDMASEIVVHLIRKRYATKVLDMDTWPRKRLLGKIGQQIASVMRDDYEHFNGNFRYSTDEVRRYLENGAIEDSLGVENIDNHGNPASEWMPLKSEAGAGRMVIGQKVEVEPFDIRATLPLLTKNHRDILVRRFMYGDSLQPRDRKTLQRAIESLTNLMNRAFRKTFADHQGPGSQARMSNAQAINETRRNE